MKHPKQATSNGNHKDLAGATFTALKWNYGGTFFRALSQFLIGIVLARILGPEPFGLVTVAWLLIGLGNLVADFGFGAALVQRKEISEREIRYTLTVQVLIGVGLALFVASSAGLVAHLFKQQAVTPILRVLSLIFVIQSFSQTATSLLKRDLNFKSIQLAQVLSYLVPFLMLGIPLAYLGFEVWSLVIAQLSQSILYAILVYAQVRHSIKPLLISDADFWDFGIKVMVNNLVSWISNTMDNVVVVSFFGVVELGLYNRAFTLMAMPMSNVVSVLQGVLFPTYSRAQNDSTALKQVYLASMSVVALLTLPVFTSIVVIPHTVITGLYGNQWLGAVPLLVPLALAMPFYAVMSLSGPLLYSKGKPEQEMYAQMISALIFSIVLFVTAKLSIEAIAWGVVGVYALRFILVTRAVLRTIDASWRNLFQSMSGALLIAIFSAGLIWSVEHVLLLLKLPALTRLGVEIITGGTAVVGLLILAPKVFFASEVFWLANRFSSSFSPNFKHLITKMHLVDATSEIK